MAKVSSLGGPAMALLVVLGCGSGSGDDSTSSGGGQPSVGGSGGTSTPTGGSGGTSTPTGGSGGTTAPTGGAGASGAATGGAGAGGTGAEPSLDPDEVLFNESQVVAMSLDLAPADWQQITTDAVLGAADPAYFTATFVTAGTTITVGVRAKGSSSLTDKPSLKVDFDRLVVDQEFAGQVKLNLHNNDVDPSQLREYLSFGAWRAFGVAAPRTGWAELTVNGVNLGLYTVVEQVGGKFLEDHFPDYPDGDLYKPEPPAGSLEYLGATIDLYQPSIGHKRVDGTDHAALLSLLAVLDSGDDATLVTVVDVPGVLTNFAGNVALGNLDYYVGDADNYYLYESSPGRFTMIPWDMNQSQLEEVDPCGLGTNPAVDSMRFPLSARLFALPDSLATYLGAMTQMLEGPGSIEALEARIVAAEAALGEHLDATAVAELRGQISSRVADLLAAIPAVSTCPETVVSAPGP